METRETKNCPYCGEEILAVAKKCKHCGEWLPEQPKPKQMVPCPICGEEVEEGTEVCPHCKEKIDVEATLETVQESRPSNPTPTPSVPFSPVTTATASNSFFKDFLTSMSLTKGLFVLIAAIFCISLLGVFENPTVDLIATILLSIIICAMSLLVIQRVAQDRSKIDLCSWTTIGSFIASSIAAYLGRDGISNMGLDVFEFARAGDSSEQIVYLRYMIHSGIVFYVIACLLDLVSKGFMWKTAKKKFKSTIIVGIIAYAVGLLFMLSSKSLSQDVFILWACLDGFIYLIYFIMILVNGRGEYTSSNRSISEGATKPAPSSTNIPKSEPPVQSRVSSVQPPSSDSNYWMFIAGIGGLIVLTVVIILFASIKNDVDKRSAVNDNSQTTSITSTDQTSTQQEVTTAPVEPITDSQNEGKQWLEGYANNINSNAPFNLSTSITCEECEYNASENTLDLTVRLLEVTQYVDDTLYESYRMYFMTTFSEVPNLKEALQISNSTINVWLRNKDEDDIGSITYTAGDI